MRADTMFKIINRIRVNLKKSLARKNYTEDTKCECEGEMESLKHVLWQCNRYEEERIKMDTELQKRGFMGNIDVYRLIKEKNWLTFECIYNFI